MILNEILLIAKLAWSWTWIASVNSEFQISLAIFSFAEQKILIYEYKMRFTLILIPIFSLVFGQEKPSLEEIEEARRLGKIRKDWSIKDGINKIQNPVAAAGELIEKILDSDSCEYVKDIDGSIIEKCPTSKLGDLVENTGRVVSNFAEEATEKIVSKFRKVELKLEGRDFQRLVW